jgi:hypothetical protein
MSAQQSISPAPQTRGDGIVMGRVWLAGAAAIGGSVLANLLLLFLIRLLPGISGDFPPYQPAPIAIFTAAQVGIGVLVFAVIAWFARRPIRLFTIVALIALLVSCIPNVMLALNPAAAPFPGGSAFAFLMLIPFHFVAAAVAIWSLTRLSRG